VQQHLDTICGHISLGIASRDEQEYSTALVFFYKALTGYRVLAPAAFEGNGKPPFAIQMGNIYTNLGIVYGLLNIHQKELYFFAKGLKCYHSQSGLQHHTTAMSFNNLGLASKNRGDGEAAMTYFKTAHRIYCGLLGETHPLSVQTNYQIHKLQGFWACSKFNARQLAATVKNKASWSPSSHTAAAAAAAAAAKQPVDTFPGSPEPKTLVCSAV
jgi:hypothetical protein